MVMLRVRATYSGVVDLEDEEENDLEAAEVDDSEGEEELIEEDEEANEEEVDEEEDEDDEGLREEEDEQNGQNGHTENIQTLVDTELYLFEDEEEESDDDANELIFRDSVEGDHEATTSTQPVSIPVYYEESSNLGVESTVSDIVSSSFNSSTTHDGSTLFASRSSSVDIPTPTNFFQSPPTDGHLSTIKKDNRAVGKHKRADVVGGDRSLRDSMDSDDSSEYDNSSCVSFLSMESDSFSLERDPSKKLKSQNDLLNLSVTSTNESNIYGSANSSNSGSSGGNGHGYFSALGQAFGLK